MLKGLSRETMLPSWEKMLPSLETETVNSTVSRPFAESDMLTDRVESSVYVTIYLRLCPRLFVSQDVHALPALICRDGVLVANKVAHSMQNLMLCTSTLKRKPKGSSIAQHSWSNSMLLLLSSSSLQFDQGSNQGLCVANRFTN